MKNLFQNSKKILSTLFSAFAIVLAIAAVVLMQNGKKNGGNFSITRDEIEISKLLEAREPNVVESNDDISFKAFFLRDEDGDGYTEDLDEIDQVIGNTDYMFVEVNVKSEGQLKNGKITINDSNFKWKTAFIENNVIKNNYIGYTNQIELKDLNNGTQILLYGKIESKIGTNIHDYDKESLVTLTGTFVDNEQNETEITKESNLTAHWHGTTSTSIPNTYLQTYNIDNAISEEEFTANFSVGVNEITPTSPINKALLMNKQEVQMVIPELNGFKPTSVTCTSGNVVQNYNEETRTLLLSREATVDENGNITKSVSRSNTYSIKAVYPIEAYESLGQESVLLNVGVSGKSYGFNSEKYGIQESSASRTVSLVYKKISTPVPVVRDPDTWNFSTSIGTYSTKDGSYANRISKQNVQKIYDGNTYDDVTDTYPVCWTVSVGQKEKINKITLEQTSIDKFNDSINMEDYETTTGIYFSNAQNALGENGKIEVYNLEGGLLETFTKDNWGTYTNENPYKVNTKGIKVVTSAPVSNTYFYVYQIKELDDDKIAEDFTQEEFDNLTRVYTYAKGTIDVVEGQTSNTATVQNKTASAIYDMPISRVSFSSSPNEIANHETQNIRLTISASSSSIFESKWKNGTFLVKLPDEVISAELTSAAISNSDVAIKSALAYKENEKWYVRIDTENEILATYSITLNLAINANPLEPTKTGTFKLYASNKECEKYNSTIADTFDINSNGLTNDQVAYRTRSINLIASHGLITEEYISNYNDAGSMTIAPNIAEIDRSDNAKVATVNVSLANNYTEAVDEIKILGKIPFQGNTYVLNNNNLGSEYTAHIKGAITVPAELQDKATIYYTTNENPTNDLTDTNNGWTQNVTDWSTVKCYLIDLGDYVLRNTGNKIFSYEVEVPARTGYNKATFACHAVYYSLNTEVGKRRTETQPTKVGLQVVQKYNLELTKNKQGYNNILVPGATYKVVTKDLNDKDIVKIATTGSVAPNEGKLTLSGLYVGREYTVTEISTPDDYILNTNEVKFNTSIQDVNNAEVLTAYVTSGSFNDTPEVTTDANDDYLVKAKVQDEAKYTLLINTQDEEDNTLTDVRYAITGKNQGKMYKDTNGQVKSAGLLLNEPYEIQLMKSVGYYTDEAARTFTIVRDETTNRLKIVTEDEELANAIIVEEVEGQSTVTLTIKTEKIPTYNLQVLKIEEPENEEAELVYLTGAQFKFTSDDTLETEVYTVDQAEGIEISGLYNYVENKNTISGRYTLQEIKAPEGYSNNAEEITFYVEKTQDGLTVHIENENSLRTIYSAEIEENTLKLIIQDKPLFKLTKEDSEQVDEHGNPLLLPDAKFVIKELDKNRTPIDFAKDVNGNYVGEYDEETEQYIVTTDENGQIKIPLRAGDYMIKEVGYPEGYFAESNIQVFKIYGGEEEQQEEIAEITGDVEINYIDDLVELSKNVNNGISYKRAKIKLMRTLNFNDYDSYKDKDLKKNIKSLFKPIGETYSFGGVFDGQGYEIQNINITNNYTSNPYMGLFEHIDGAIIKRLGVTGNITYNKYFSEYKPEDGYGYIGGLVGFASCSTLSDCYSKVKIDANFKDTYITSSECYVGGIVGYSTDCRINNCYNAKEITFDNDLSNNGKSFTGGIAGYCTNSFISNCHSAENLYNSNRIMYTGGIVGWAADSKISNSYNESNILIESEVNSYDYNNIRGYAGGIVGNSQACIISNCYNTNEYIKGDISNNVSSIPYVYLGGIVGSAFNNSTISKCYNTGYIEGYAESANISTYNAAVYVNVGGITGDLDGARINDCYNRGNVKADSKSGNYLSSYTHIESGGIVGEANRVGNVINNCYNTGNAISGEIFNYTESDWKIFAGGITGYEYNLEWSDCYYLDSIELMGEISNVGTQKSEEEMKSIEFVTGLGSGWKRDVTSINGGFPILDITSEDSTTNILEDTIYIYYIEDLVELSNSVNSGNLYKFSTVKLVRDLDFSDNNSYRDVNSRAYGDINKNGEIEDIKTELTAEKGFTPIGENKMNSFGGTFDGQGHEIKNIHVNSNECSGLFGSIVNADIKNLGLTEGSIELNKENSKVYAGGIVGYASNSVISDCYSSVYVSAGNSGRVGVYSVYVGGIVGYTTNKCIINSCYNTGIINLKKADFNGFSGGIVGYMDEHNTISNSYNKGNIINSMISSSYSSYHGGIAGGMNDSNTISNCYNSGNISVETCTWSNGGGIVGHVSKNNTVNKCYNTGTILAYRDAGGIIGFADGNNIVYNCYNIGDVTSTNSGHYNDDCAGGIIARARSDKYKGGLSKCYNTGKISGKWAGGIVADSRFYAISDCYNTGEINGEYVGGIVKENAKGSVNNCYNVGDISGIDAGGIINNISNNGTISNCYYLENIKINANVIRDFGESKTVVEMCSKDFFNTLNADRVWKYNVGEYPTLEDMDITPAKIEEMTELTIKNTINKYTISVTSIGSDGGIIDGENEIVQYAGNNTRAIKFIPNQGYEIAKITINDKDIVFETEQDGSYIIPANFFTNVKENKNIVVTFAASDSIFTLNVVDEDDNSKVLEGATYEITTDDREEITTEIRDIVNNGTYYFEESDGKYISNNQNQNSKTANSYISIDLTEKTGKYDLRVNAEVSSEAGGDFGYATISTGTAAPYYNNTSGRFIYISGNLAAKDYMTTLEGGKIYYLHLGYYKNGSYSYGTDTFTINNIELTLNRDDNYYEIATTNELGKINAVIPGGSSVFIREIEAPEGYTKNPDINTYTLLPGQTNEMTVTNKEQTKVLVHHYYKDTTNKVADDEIYKGDIGTEYTTSPRNDLDKLTIAKDSEDNYIIPEYAQGIYEQNREIAYYYEVEPVYLTIHHFIEGTEDRLAEDETIEQVSNIEFVGEAEYKVSANSSYVLKNNESYNSLLNHYYFVGFMTDNEDELTIDDTLEYSTDKEITYLYMPKKYEYTINYYYENGDDEEVVRSAYYLSEVNPDTDNIKTGYYFDSAEAFNQSGETVNLPLIVGDIEENNIINVYYKMIRENYSVQKVFNDINDSQAQSYKSTFILQKTINGVTTNCTDVNNQDITCTITGNGTYTFEGLPSYEDGNRVIYTVKQINVTKDSTIILSDSDYITEHQKVSSTSEIFTDTLVTTYKVQNQWDISNPDESKNYRSTFVLYKTDGESEPQEVTDIYEINVVKVVDQNGEVEYRIADTADTRAMGTVVGNGTITFANLPKYENGKELTYSVEEVKIEVTDDDGISWNERNIDTFVITHGTAEGVDELITNGRIFNITTKIEMGEGTVTGEFNENFPEEDGIRFVESVYEGSNGTTDIEIIPSNGNEILYILINGEVYDFTPDQDGKVIIPSSYFTNVTCDYSIEMAFGDPGRTIKVIKTDEEGNRLEGAKFRISSSSDSSSGLSDCIGDMTQYDEYYFVPQDDGSYINNNQSVSDSVAVSYSKIDLSRLSGTYTFSVNAEISSEDGNDYGYIVISKIAPGEATGSSSSTSSSTSSSDSAGIIPEAAATASSGSVVDETCYLVRVSGKKDAQDYRAILEGGETYYIYYVYGKNDYNDYGSDTFTIRNISLTETSIITDQIQKYDENSSYYFEQQDNGTWVSNNGGTYNTTAVSYMVIDLENESGEYNLVINAKVSSYENYDWGYIVLSEDNPIDMATGSSTSSSSSSSDAFEGDSLRYIMRESGDVPSKDYITQLEGGKKYYVYFVYGKSNNGSSGDDKFTINSVTLESKSAGESAIVVTNSNGEAFYEPSEYGTYKVKEIKAPPHYIMTEEEKEVELVSTEKNQSVSFVNRAIILDITTEVGENTLGERSGGTITGEYTDEYPEENYKKLSEKVMEAHDALNDIVINPSVGYKVESIKVNNKNYTFIPDENGNVVIPKSEFTNVTKNQHIIVTFAEEEKTITIVKTDKTTGAPLPGAKFKFTSNFEREPKLDYLISDMYKGNDDYYFVYNESNGTYTNNNKNQDNTVAYGYKIVDLTGIEGNRTLTINAKVSSESGCDHGYVVYAELNSSAATGTGTSTSTGTVENSDYNYDDMVNPVEMFRISGDEDSQDYTVELEGGKKYIVYFVYGKDSSNSYGTDTFTINSVHLNTVSGPIIAETGLTDENGIATAKITGYGEYTVQEIVTPDDYVTMNDMTYELVASDTNPTLNIENVREGENKSTYTVNYYEKGTTTPIETAKTSDEVDVGSRLSSRIDIIMINGFVYDSVDVETLTIGSNVEENVINIYYTRRNNLSYTIHHVLKARTRNIIYVADDITVGNQTFGDVVTVHAQDVPGYRKLEPTTADITITTGTNEYTFYYEEDDFNYTVHYFYDGVEDESKVETLTGMFNEVISTYEDKIEPGYALSGVSPVDPTTGELALKITNNSNDNVIDVFYRTEYKITTEAKVHTERYIDGTTTNIKGGSISGDGLTSYENVFKGEDSTKAIVIVPNSGYEIVSVKVNDESIDFEGLLSESGSLTLNAANGFFTNMDSNKHVEVEFRKKSSVIVKYLEKDTNEVLSPEETISGYDEKAFETSRKNVNYYRAVNITDEEGNAISSYGRITSDDTVSASGTMYADTLTIIYWYERIPAGILVKHIAINEVDKQNLSLSSGEILDEEDISGYVGLTETATRNVYDASDESTAKYKDYVAVNGPAASGHIVIAAANENSKSATYQEDTVVEIRFYYEKQHKVTTEVIPHDETVEDETISVAGGTISGSSDEVYEVINEMGYNTKEIVITPNTGYRVKEITINGTMYPLSELSEGEAHVITLGAGSTDAFFKNVQEDKHVTVKFERIPARVIVKYKDVATNEEVIGVPEKVVEGYVGKTYNEPAVEVPGYIKATPTEEYPEPISEGVMGENPIEIVHWYTKQFTITVDAEEGGTGVIEGDVDAEIVTRGNSNRLKITIRPNSGYKLDKIFINDEELDYMHDENIVIKFNSLEIPERYFTDIQENKHVVIKFAKIDEKPDDTEPDDKEDKDNPSDEKQDSDSEPETKTAEEKQSRKHKSKSVKTGDVITYYLAAIVISGVIMIVAIRKKLK